jgi:hypothetical protein
MSRAGGKLFQGKVRKEKEKGKKKKKANKNRQHAPGPNKKNNRPGTRIS